MKENIKNLQLLLDEVDIFLRFVEDNFERTVSGHSTKLDGFDQLKQMQYNLLELLSNVKADFKLSLDEVQYISYEEIINDLVNDLSHILGDDNFYEFIISLRSIKNMLEKFSESMMEESQMDYEIRLEILNLNESIAKFIGFRGIPDDEILKERISYLGDGAI